MQAINSIGAGVSQGAEEVLGGLNRGLPEAANGKDRKSAMELRSMMAGGARSATVLLSSARCEAQAQSEYIQPEISLSYERHAVDSNSGKFSVRISLINKSSHVACQPFLCLPNFGLLLSPAPGWNMQDISSVRRLRRFGQDHAQLLNPDGSVHCCNISLLFTANGGGRVEYDAGNWHDVKNLPDLRLTCVAGAGNYPSERLPLVVPAAALKDFMTELVALGEIPDEVIEFNEIDIPSAGP